MARPPALGCCGVTSPPSFRNSGATKRREDEDRGHRPPEPEIRNPKSDPLQQRDSAARTNSKEGTWPKWKNGTTDQKRWELDRQLMRAIELRSMSEEGTPLSSAPGEDYRILLYFVTIVSIVRSETGPAAVSAWRRFTTRASVSSVSCLIKIRS